MNYPLSKKYEGPAFESRIMGPNPLKLTEELLLECPFPKDAPVLDLGSGQGVTSAFLAKEYGLQVYAADLWSEPSENQKFFDSLGIPRERLIPVKADATALPFPEAYFGGVISTDSYNYFGRDPGYLDEKLLPFVKKGGHILIAVPGMKKDCHENLPPELLLSWNAEQLDYIHDRDYWESMVQQSKNARVLRVCEMESNGEVWADWLRQDNEYARNDRKSMENGAAPYLNFIAITLQKK